MEPVYTYKKSVGWTIDTTNIYTCKCGTRVRLEKRMPNIGEAWYRDNPGYKPELSFQKHASIFRFSDWAVYRGTETEYYPDKEYYTLVKV